MKNVLLIKIILTEMEMVIHLLKFEQGHTEYRK